MKYIVCILFFLFAFNLYSQENEWYEFEMDSIISFYMPSKEITESDTLIENVKIKTLNLNYGNHNFLAQKLKEKANFSDLPSDSLSLIRYYNRVIKGMDKSMIHKIGEKNLIKRNNLLGYKVNFIDSTKHVVFESNIFLLGHETYTFSYINYYDFDIDLKDVYLNSITIKNPQNISQFNGTEKSILIIQLIGDYLGWAMLLFILIFGAVKIFNR